MVFRLLFVKLKPEFRQGLKFVQFKQAAQTALMGVYGAQSVRCQRAFDARTEHDWDLCITIEYVSGIDEERSAQDTIRLTFENKFLATRADKIWSGAFSSDERAR